MKVVDCDVASSLWSHAMWASRGVVMLPGAVARGWPVVRLAEHATILVS